MEASGGAHAELQGWLVTEETVCQRIGCEAQATRMVVVVVPPPRWSHPYPDEVAAKGYLPDIVVCALHKDVREEQVVCDELWAGILKTIAERGCVTPLRGDIRVDTVPIEQGRGRPDCGSTTAGGGYPRVGG